MSEFDHACEECEFCKHGKRFVWDKTMDEQTGRIVSVETNKQAWTYFCVRDIETPVEIHPYDDACQYHGDFLE